MILFGQDSGVVVSKVLEKSGKRRLYESAALPTELRRPVNDSKWVTRRRKARADGNVPYPWWSRYSCPPAISVTNPLLRVADIRKELTPPVLLPTGHTLLA